MFWLSNLKLSHLKLKLEILKITLDWRKYGRYLTYTLPHPYLFRTWWPSHQLPSPAFLCQGLPWPLKPLCPVWGWSGVELVSPRSSPQQMTDRNWCTNTQLSPSGRITRRHVVNTSSFPVEWSSKSPKCQLAWLCTLCCLLPSMS